MFGAEHEPLQQSNNTHLMACWANFHWVAFPSHALAGQLNNPNVIFAEEIELNSPDLTTLWVHKSASDWALLDALWPKSFQTVLRCSVLKFWTLVTLHCSTSLFCFTSSFSLRHILRQHLMVFAPDADEMSTCVSLTALLCDTVTTLGP